MKKIEFFGSENQDLSKKEHRFLASLPFLRLVSLKSVASTAILTIHHFCVFSFRDLWISFFANDLELNINESTISLYWYYVIFLINVAFLKFQGLLFRPTLAGEGLYSNEFLLFSQFWPIDIFIVESCEWYHYRARPALNMELFFWFSFFWRR